MILLENKIINNYLFNVIALSISILCNQLNERPRSNGSAVILSLFTKNPSSQALHNDEHNHHIIYKGTCSQIG